MKQSKFGAQVDAEPTVLQRVMRRVARFLLQPLALALVIQPATFAAPNPSLLAQLPKYMGTTAASNAVFVMDDSQSMLMMELPTPPGITPSGPFTGPITFALEVTPRPLVPGNVTTATSERWQWILKSPTLNPAYYNPTITYKPWNYDGRVDGVDALAFKKSDITITVETDGFRRGKTPHDARFTNATTATTAWPNHLGSGARAKDDRGNTIQRFAGAAKNTAGTWGGQDIFSRPMVRTICEQCSVPAAPATMQCAEHTNCSGALGPWEDVNFSTLSAPPPRSCAAAVESGSVNKGPDARWYCATGTLSTTGAPFACTAGAFAEFNDGNLPFCCPGGVINTTCATVTNCPAGQACPTVGRFVTKPNELVIAHYFRFDDPDPNNNTGGDPDKNNPNNYKLVELERYKTENADGTGGALNDHLFPVRTIDGVEVASGDTTIRPECTGAINGKKVCTWAQEAQNFANWYTYYRTRLFSAIAVTAEALSGLTSANLLDSLRLGYGSTNYFTGSVNPYGAIHPWDLPAAAATRTIGDVDPTGAAGFVSNYGTLTRGVREFRQGTVDRTQVFNWLFSLRPQGATPSREALDSVGRYFSRRDALGPWSQTPGAAPTLDGRPVDQHESCRRSYAILVTDGEWTATEPAVGAPPVQPLIDNGARQAAIPSWVASQSAATPLNAALTAGPTINNGVGEAKDRVFPPPGGQPQFSTVNGSPTKTLADAAYYWWSRDLRPDIDNGVRPIDNPPERVNESFWQNVTPYIVGYGLTATMDTPMVRNNIIDARSISWPLVNTNSGVVRDSDCGSGSGCGRINDALRAARMARGDFFAATDIATLARKVAEVLATISEAEGSAAAYTGRSATLRPGDLLYSTNFTTGKWTGSVEAFDAIDLNKTILEDKDAPAPKFVSNFPAERHIFTSRDIAGAGVEFNLGALSANQKTILGDNGQAGTNNPANAIIAWMSGNQSVEAQNSGTLRNRGAGETLGDIVNSKPLYSWATNERYAAYRSPKAAKTGAATYPAYVKAKELTRRATIFAGANDGMLHAFSSDLVEKFAYVPRSVYVDLPALTATGYIHKYYVDGPLVESDVYINDKWRTVLVGTNGAGPKGVFALDVTQLSTDLKSHKDFDQGDVLWDIDANNPSSVNDDTKYLGHITQPGVIGGSKDGRWYYFTGNGWESKEDKARLLAIDIQTGKIEKAIAILEDVGGSNPTGNLTTDTPNNAAAQPNGLGGITPIYDANRNIVAIYAGDRLGRLWKFISDDAGNWTSEKVFTTAEYEAPDGVIYRQPISAAPLVMAHPNGGRLIVVGTGRLTESTDISDVSVQSIYALWEPNPSKGATPITPGELHEITLEQAGVLADRSRARTIKPNGFSWLVNKKGWRLDLKAGEAAFGERVVVQPIEQGGFVHISTFEPVANGDKCQGGGASFFYRFDIAQTFKRHALNAANADIVGYELRGGSVGGMHLFGTGSGDSAGTVTAITKDELTAALKNFGRNGSAEAAVGSPCSSTAGGRSIANTSLGLGLTQCPAHSQRVWRELPRGAQ